MEEEELMMQVGGIDVIHDESHAAYYRIVGHDRRILRPKSFGGRVIISQEDHVLDLGANIGSFTRHALQSGAAHVVSVEADPDTALLLRMNCELSRERSTIISAAVSHNPGLVAQFYISNNTEASTLHAGPKSRCRRVIVPTVGFGDLLALHPFTVVKIDIEGEELFLDYSALPPTVNVIAIDYHVFGSDDKMDQVRMVHTRLTQLGFASADFHDTFKSTSEFLYRRAS